MKFLQDHGENLSSSSSSFPVFHHHQKINEIGKGLIFNTTLTNLNIVRTAISEKAINAMARRKNISCDIEW